MVKFFVSVQVGGLAEHLLRLLGQGVLVLHLDARLQLLRIALLLSDLALDVRLLPELVLGLELDLVLEVALEGASEETICF